MQFHSLRISNLRAIRQFEATDLGSFVVVAGQNGSGKSCVFDAIRVLKSVYGGYLANEYHQWFGEFQINLQDRSSLGKLFRNVDKFRTYAVERECLLAWVSTTRSNISNGHYSCPS